MTPVARGTTSRSMSIELVDSTTGLPKTGIAYAAVTADYKRTRSAPVTITTFAMATTTTAYTSGGWIELGGGIYRLDVPNAAFATGADELVVTIAATGCRTVSRGFDLWGVDPQDAQRMAMTALPATGTLAVTPQIASLSTADGHTIGTSTLAAGAKMDLVDAPNATAVTAIQSGLSKPGTAQTITPADTAAAATAQATIASNLDAKVSSRSTYAGTDTLGTTSLLSRLTAGRGNNLDFLDAAITSRSSFDPAVSNVKLGVGGIDVLTFTGSLRALLSRGYGYSTSTTTPATADTYAVSGTYGGIPVYAGVSTNYVLWSNGTRWYCSRGTGVTSGNYWTGNANVGGTYAASGTASGTLTVNFKGNAILNSYQTAVGISEGRIAADLQSIGGDPNDPIQGLSALVNDYFSQNAINANVVSGGDTIKPGASPLTWIITLNGTSQGISDADAWITLSPTPGSTPVVDSKRTDVYGYVVFFTDKFQQDGTTRIQYYGWMQKTGYSSIVAQPLYCD